MLISIIRHIQGYLKIRITGYSPERFLNLCKNKKIAVWGLSSEHNAYTMYMKVSGFRKLKPILKKTQTKVSILERFGLPFFFHKYRKRKLFFLGICICLILIYSMTFFIWNIELQGNQTVTDNVLYEYLETKKVFHGMKKKDVNCEQIVKDIRLNFDEIIWVSASLEGTKLSIHVKENSDSFKVSDEESEPSDLITDKAGIIVRIVTRNGVPKVKVGDEVQAGDTLVSGTVEVLNDAKEVAAYKFVTADADIVLETIHHYADNIEKKYEKKKYTDKKRVQFYFRVKDMNFKFGWGKNSFKHKEYHMEETQLKIGKNFYLPICIGKNGILDYKLEKKEYGKEELDKLLKERFKLFCDKLEEQGTVILDKNLIISHDTKGAKANAEILLQESIGIHRKIVDLSQPPMVE